MRWLKTLRIKHLAEYLSELVDLWPVSLHHDKVTYHVLLSATLSGGGVVPARASEIDATWQAKLMLSRRVRPTEGFVRAASPHKHRALRQRPAPARRCQQASKRSVSTPRTRPGDRPAERDPTRDDFVIQTPTTQQQARNLQIGRAHV